MNNQTIASKQPQTALEEARFEGEGGTPLPAQPSHAETPISNLLRRMLEGQTGQRFLQAAIREAEKAGIKTDTLDDVGKGLVAKGRGWVEHKTQQKPLQALALVFAAGFFMAQMGRGRR
jgi:hypothetical protein